MSTDGNQIESVVQDYLDALYHCDTALLARVLHPQAVYATASGEQPLILRMAEYLPIVAQRDPPSRQGDERRERILSIQQFGPVTAQVTLTCRFFQKDYTDLLSFIKVGGQWQIIAKVFHFEPVA
jgi:hypothetical protein